MPLIKETATGPNFLQKHTSQADLGRVSVIQHYEKQAGSDGPTAFTLSKPYIPDTYTLWVFINGQRAEPVASASLADEYEETDAYTVTFGAALQSGDVIEFMVAGAYRFDASDFESLINHTPGNYALDTGEAGLVNRHLGGVDNQIGIMGGFKNLLINGNFQIPQRGTSFTGLGYGDTGYTLDQWRWAEGGSTTGEMDVKQTADHPLTTNGFCLEIDVTTAQASPAASDQVRIQEIIEGQSLQRLLYGGSDAKTMAVSFWVKSYQTGVFPVSLNQEDGTYSFVSTYTVNASNTWEYKTVSIPGNTAAGIGNDNTEGLRLTFALMAGTDFETAALNQWNSGNYKSTSGAVNILSSTSNNWRLADVQLEVGEVATPFEQRDIGGVELRLCQRYFEKSWNLADAIGTATVAGRVALRSTGTTSAFVPFKARKRSVPTVKLYSVSTGNVNYWDHDGTPEAAPATSNGETDFTFNTTAGVLDDFFAFQWTAEDEL